MEWDLDCIHSMPWQTIPASKFLVEKRMILPFYLFKIGHQYMKTLAVTSQLVSLVLAICSSCLGPMWALWLAQITSYPWLPWQRSWRARRSTQATCQGSYPPVPGGVTSPSPGTFYAPVPGVVTPQSVDHPTPAFSAIKKGEQIYKS